MICFVIGSDLCKEVVDFFFYNNFKFLLLAAMNFLCDSANCRNWFFLALLTAGDSLNKFIKLYLLEFYFSEAALWHLIQQFQIKSKCKPWNFQFHNFFGDLVNTTEEEFCGEINLEMMTT